MSIRDNYKNLDKVIRNRKEYPANYNRKGEVEEEFYSASKQRKSKDSRLSKKEKSHR